MGRPSKGARWWFDKGQKKYFIRDGETKFSLGFGKEADDHETRVERELAKYIAEKHAGDRLKIRNQDVGDVLVADIISKYIDVRITKWQLDYDGPPARQHEVEARLSVLLDFFGGMSVEEINDDSVSEFIDYLDELAFQRAAAKAQAKHDKLKRRRDYKPENDPGMEPVERKFNPQAAVRYLDDLRAAVGVAHRKKLIRHLVTVPSPKNYKPRSAVFTRKQVADLIRAAWRKKGMAFVDGKPVKEVHIWRHMARFLLIAIYTGSRKGKVWRVSFADEKDRPWVKLRKVRTQDGGTRWRGTFFRLGDDEQAHATKAAPEIEVPARLVAHFVRWRDLGMDYPCEDIQGHAGDPSKAMRKLFKEVLGDDSDAVIHTLRHTAATWLVYRAELPLAAIAGYLGMSIETLVRRYAKVRKTDQIAIGQAFTQSRAGAEFEDDIVGHGSGLGRFAPQKALTETDRNKPEQNGEESKGNRNSSMKSMDAKRQAA
ncbi:putative phage integrase [Sinorhizobium fredii NGR234]|uniref:Phage integrase n=1 Tax=Sinorhizobium fredii (strain NBRC 101917 / NGR234) TaxID=394 RepID=C3MID8_SINFN|nr:putative phage integrase [Sinorhizobium fredii NGR234]